MATTTVKTKKAQIFSSRIDLPVDVRTDVVAFLNKVLASTFDLYSQTKQAHWNVKGSDFYQLHKLFDQLAEELFEYIDPVAERATALGGLTMGTVRMAGENSGLAEYPMITQGRDHLSALAKSYASFGKMLREGIEKMIKLEDQDSADLLIQVSRKVDQHLWFIEAHMQA